MDINYKKVRNSLKWIFGFLGIWILFSFLGIGFYEVIPGTLEFWSGSLLAGFGVSCVIVLFLTFTIFLRTVEYESFGSNRDMYEEKSETSSINYKRLKE